MASGVRTIELAKALSKLGVETVIFTPYEKNHLLEGIQIINMPTIFSSIGLEKGFYDLTRQIYYSRELQRFVIKISQNLLKIPLKFRKILKESKLDILQAEQDNAALMMLSGNFDLDIPLVLDLHGIWPEELLAANTVKKGSKVWVGLQGALNHILENVDLTICLSDAMKDYVLSNYTVDARDVAVVQPGGRVFCNDYKERSLPWKVVYAGIVSYRKHVDLFIKSMPHIKNRITEIEFNITKRGDLLAPIQKIAKSLGVNPNYFWYKDLKNTLNFLSSCHIGVLPSTKDTSARISMPSKLFDYMSVGLPIVANDVGGWTDIVKKNNLGRISKDSPVSFAHSIVELLSDPEELIRCGRNGIQAIKETYNWDKSAESLLNCYKQLLKHNTPKRY